MAQPLVSSYFITRKRGLEDDVVQSKKKVICLERARSSSESQDNHTDSEELSTKIVFPKTLETNSSNDDEPKKMVKKPTIRQGITPQRTTRSKKVHMQIVEGIETPKIVNFWKGGNLSPQKKPKSVEVITKATTIVESSETKSDEAPINAGFSTPTKKNVGGGSIEKTKLMSSNGMNADEVKKKLKGSARLTELKTAMNKLQGGLDKLDQMEKKRLVSAPIKAAAESVRTLKPFKSIELEIMRLVFMKN